MNEKQNTNANQIRNVNQNDQSRSDSNLSRAKEQLAPKTIEQAPSPGDEQAP